MPLSPSSKVTVIVPTYGHAPFIAQCLESLLRQTHPPDRVIVINDGSPDDTDTAVFPYLGSIEYYKQPHQGIAQSVNRALELVRSEYVHLIGSDDWLMPTALEILEQILDANDDVGVVHANRWKVDSEGRATFIPCVEHTGKYRPLPALIMKNTVWGPTVMVRRSALDRDYRIPDFHFCQDWAMTLAIALRGWSFFGVGSPLGYYRRHANNTTHVKNQRKIVENEIAMLKWAQASMNLPVSLESVFARSIVARERGLSWLHLAADEHSIARSEFKRLWASGDREWNTLLLAVAVHLPSNLYNLAHGVTSYRVRIPSRRI
ncbi:MAG: hypothetical protein C7B45_01425 [Sulfobacillus acidophilus]|uniref:Glycosyltransferase 2-like domain-containing protein n=1 Tax=Sulfobacillus acidophilus TaxID=53633 RepID=A0A2T2WP21_9FIRM|nr:MAG: hypothetical protein C7B45_01425 [Sulfobacillus acidophilus]